MLLRPYQNECVEATFKWWNDRGLANVLNVLPTAAGKTVVFSEIIKRLWREHECRVLVLAHRKELVEQAEKKLLSVWPDAPVGVMAAGLGRREVRPITIASRDTIAPIIEHFRADVAIIDEAHNIPPKDDTRYRKIINALGAAVVGFTATPYRTGAGVIYGEDKLFSGVCYEKKIGEMIDEGWLCPPTSKQVAGEINVDNVRTTAGDYNFGDLDKAARAEGLVAKAIDEWQRLAVGRHATIFFAVSVAHAELILSELARRGLPAPLVTGETPAGLRKATLERFEAGNIQRIVNVGVLTEGYDCPRVDCICLMRPTKSLGLYLQMVGRGFRLHPDKANCLVLDFGGNIARFGPIDTARPPAPRKKQDRTKACPVCLEVVGFFARKCSACSFQFEPQPVKTCDVCGAPNAPSASVCDQCEGVFARHEHQASHKGILSKDLRPKTYTVKEIDFQALVSQQTGKPFLMVVFWVNERKKPFYKPICLGYDGWAGRKAARDWRELVLDGDLTPCAPEDAVRLGPGLLKPIKAVTVNMASQWEEVLRVHFTDDTRADLDNKARKLDEVAA